MPRPKWAARSPVQRSPSVRPYVHGERAILTQARTKRSPIRALVVTIEKQRRPYHSGLRDRAPSVNVIDPEDMVPPHRMCGRDHTERAAYPWRPRALTRAQRRLRSRRAARGARVRGAVRPRVAATARASRAAREREAHAGLNPHLDRPIAPIHLRCRTRRVNPRRSSTARAHPGLCSRGARRRQQDPRCGQSLWPILTCACPPPPPWWTSTRPRLDRRARRTAGSTSGALTRHTDLLTTPLSGADAPARAARRTSATGDPIAAPCAVSRTRPARAPAVLLALDAPSSSPAVRGGRRPLGDFFMVSLRRRSPPTNRRPGDLPGPPSAGWGFEELALRAVDLAVAASPLSFRGSLAAAPRHGWSPSAPTIAPCACARPRPPSRRRRPRVAMRAAPSRRGRHPSTTGPRRRSAGRALVTSHRAGVPTRSRV